MSKVLVRSPKYWRMLCWLTHEVQPNCWQRLSWVVFSQNKTCRGGDSMWVPLVAHNRFTESWPRRRLLLCFQNPSHVSNCYYRLGVPNLTCSLISSLMDAYPKLSLHQKLTLSCSSWSLQKVQIMSISNTTMVFHCRVHKFDIIYELGRLHEVNCQR